MSLHCSRKNAARINGLDRPYFYCYKAIVRNPRPDRIWEIITRVNTVQWRGQKDSVPDTPCRSRVSSRTHPGDRNHFSPCSRTWWLIIDQAQERVPRPVM